MLVLSSCMIQDPMSSSVDYEDIVHRGELLYATRLKSQYEPLETGKYLAIDVDAGKCFLGQTGADALVLATQAHPEKIFYLKKIGYDAAESIAKSVYKKKI